MGNRRGGEGRGEDCLKLAVSYFNTTILNSQIWVITDHHCQTLKYPYLLFLPSNESEGNLRVTGEWNRRGNRVWFTKSSTRLDAAGRKTEETSYRNSSWSMSLPISKKCSGSSHWCSLYFPLLLFSFSLMSSVRFQLKLWGLKQNQSQKFTGKFTDSEKKNPERNQRKVAARSKWEKDFLWHELIFIGQAATQLFSLLIHLFFSILWFVLTKKRWRLEGGRDECLPFLHNDWLPKCLLIHLLSNNKSSTVFICWSIN